MKLVIQIPCFNEEKTLPITIKDLPREVEGFDKVELLVINDGSSDNTVQVAQKLGVEHIVSFDTNKGLARAFALGIEKCLDVGADVVVNTDADNQYQGQYVRDLVRPILRGQADVVVGRRPIERIDEFSMIKKFFQKFGSKVISFLGRCNVPDAASGFRAYSRYAAMNLVIVSPFTYTHETLIQAGHKNMKIASVDIEVNPKTRESRLFRNIFEYIFKSMSTIVLVFIRYRPLPIFIIPGTAAISFGVLLCIRFLYLFFNGEPDGHIQSIILAAILIISGVIFSLMGLLAEMVASSRRVNEEVLMLLRRNNFNKNSPSA